MVRRKYSVNMSASCWIVRVKLSKSLRCIPKYSDFLDGHTGSMNRQLASIADLLSEPARAAILLNLMNGRALAAGELAFAANVAPQTASGHLAKLLEGQFVRVEKQGRHRYYRLGGTEVADAIEALLVLAPIVCPKAKRQTTVPVTGTFAHARTCYAHLAGWLGVRIADSLHERGLIFPGDEKTFRISKAGKGWLGDQGIKLPRTRIPETKLARQCLDWTERRPHLAGPLGVAIYRHLLHMKWVVPMKNTRAVRVTDEGKRELWRLLRIPIG